jgi:hypothetical protein
MELLWHGLQLKPSPSVRDLSFSSGRPLHSNAFFRKLLAVPFSKVCPRLDRGNKFHVPWVGNAGDNFGKAAHRGRLSCCATGNSASASCGKAAGVFEIAADFAKLQHIGCNHFREAGR